MWYVFLFAIIIAISFSSIILCFTMYSENRCEEETDCDVLANSQWNGVPSRGEVCTQRPCCKELHVSEQSSS